MVVLVSLVPRTKCPSLPYGIAKKRGVQPKCSQLLVSLDRPCVVQEVDVKTNGGAGVAQSLSTLVALQK